MMRSVVLLLSLASAWPGAVHAQAIGRVSFEVAAGGGPNSERSGETWFRDTQSAILRAGATVRFATIGDRVAAIARVDYDAPAMGDRLTDCEPAPNGSCRAYFPDMSGFAIGAGAVMAPTSRLLIGASGGVFRALANRYVALDVSYDMFRHVAAITEWRYMSRQFGVAGRVSFRPIQIGARVF
jgi:hypothetical protein